MKKSRSDKIITYLPPSNQKKSSLKMNPKIEKNKTSKYLL